MKKAIFLDRDGIVNNAIIVNKRPYAPTRIKDVYPTKRIKELIKKWHEMGYLVIVVTNQSDVANGVTTKRKVDKINDYLKSLVKFDDVFTCYHNDKDKCACRKPKTGLLDMANEKYKIDFSNSYMVGDRRKDIEAGKQKGCKTIFVKYDYDEPDPINPDYIVKTVEEIGDIIRG